MQPNYIASSSSSGQQYSPSQLEMSPVDKHKAKYGDTGQGQYLILAKENSTSKNKQQLFQDEIKEDSQFKNK